MACCPTQEGDEGVPFYVRVLATIYSNLQCMVFAHGKVWQLT